MVLTSYRLSTEDMSLIVNDGKKTGKSQSRKHGTQTREKSKTKVVRILMMRKTMRKRSSWAIHNSGTTTSPNNRDKMEGYRDRTHRGVHKKTKE
jgi:hypothetical protein